MPDQIEDSRTTDLHIHIRQASHTVFRGHRKFRIRFSLHPEIVKAVGLGHGEKIALEYSEVEPTWVGLTRFTEIWNQDDVVSGQFRDATPDRSECLADFSSRETSDTMLPPDLVEYDPEIEVDSEGGIIWFPLPYGRSIHGLRPFFGSRWPGLEAFIHSWFVERLRGIPYGKTILPPDYQTYVIRPVHPEDKTKVTVRIPDELLLDPIRNGSPNREYGFNPWDRKQRAEIEEFLESITREMFALLFTPNPETLL